MITVEDSRFMVEDYVMVMTMSSSLITFKMKQNIIELTGEQLLIDYYSSYEIRGHGIIQEIRFVPL